VTSGGLVFISRKSSRTARLLSSVAASRGVRSKANKSLKSCEAPQPTTCNLPASAVARFAISGVSPHLRGHQLHAIDATMSCSMAWRCRLGPNGLKIEKETTHFIVRWTRVASMA
jgi:hypothetical protein